MRPSKNKPKRGNHPPKPALAFQVGIVGHRPNRLKSANLKILSLVIQEILGKVRDIVHGCYSESKKIGLFKDSDPVLRAVSSLADGSDRLFAEQALDLGYHLCCPMPFFQKEYEKDFKSPNSMEDNSLNYFRALLERAWNRSGLVVFELDGDLSKKSKAYAAAGKVVVNQSDILFAVWDGQNLNHSGGTEESIEEAKRQGIPIIIIKASAPHSWEIISGENQSCHDNKAPSSGSTIKKGDPWCHLYNIIESLIFPPNYKTPEKIGILDRFKSYNSFDAIKRFFKENTAKPFKIDAFWKRPQMFGSSLGEFFKTLFKKKYQKTHFHHSIDSRKAIQEFFCEKEPSSKHFPWHLLAVLWRWFRNFLGECKISKPHSQSNGVEQAVIYDWPNDQSTPVNRMIERLRPYFAWPDQLAIFYGDTYRGAFISIFLLAATAVFMAILPVGFNILNHCGEKIFIILEGILISIILFLVTIGRLKCWHEKWIDYRLAAELVRHMRLVTPLGGSRPFPKMPAHLSAYGPPGAKWMAWYARMVERHIGLVNIRMDKPYLKDCLKGLSDLMAEQIAYHQTNHKRCHFIEARLHWIGNSSFLLTFIMCILHLLPNLSKWGSLFTILGVWLPAFGASLAGIKNQGEFHRIEKRSYAMIKQLEKLNKEADRLMKIIDSLNFKEQQQFSVKVAELAGDVSELLIREVLDWRVVFIDRPLCPPA